MGPQRLGAAGLPGVRLGRSRALPAAPRAARLGAAEQRVGEAPERPWARACKMAWRALWQADPRGACVPGSSAEHLVGGRWTGFAAPRTCRATAWPGDSASVIRHASRGDGSRRTRRRPATSSSPCWRARASSGARSLRDRARGWRAGAGRSQLPDGGIPGGVAGSGSRRWSSTRAWCSRAGLTCTPSSRTRNSRVPCGAR